VGCCCAILLSSCYQIDKYLYSTDSHVVAGALLAVGIVNCGVRNECDPAYALLYDSVTKENPAVRIGAIQGLGLAYAGTAKEEVADLLCPLVRACESQSPPSLGWHVTVLAQGGTMASPCGSERWCPSRNRTVESHRRFRYHSISELGLHAPYTRTLFKNDAPTPTLPRAGGGSSASPSRSFSGCVG